MIEDLAKYAHDAWAGWMKYLFEQSNKNDDGTVTIPKWAVDRWERQSSTAYSALPKDEKHSDRKEAERILKVISGSQDNGSVSDGNHTFDELYEFRKLYNAALFNEWAVQGKFSVHKSKKHFDGEECFGGGWFIVVAVLPSGQISNHYKLEDWELFQVRETEKALCEFDGHTAGDVADRLASLCSDPEKLRSDDWRIRVLEENLDLQCKSVALSIFLCSAKFNGLPFAQKKLLRKQYSVMAEYSTILKDRYEIDREDFGPDKHKECLTYPEAKKKAFDNPGTVKITRVAGLEGGFKYLSCQAGSVIDSKNARGGAAKCLADDGHEFITIHSHLDAVTHDNEVLVGWVPSEREEAALDWFVVD